MQLEDKLVDGLEAAHAESRQREDLEDRGEDLLPEPVNAAIVEAGLAQRGRLLDAIRLIFDRQTVEVASLYMPAGETRALEALQIATTGRGELGQFVYAEDRRDLLERALAALQPSLSTHELHAQVGELSARVSEIREQLASLEDAQDEAATEHRAAPEQVGDPSDKPEPPSSAPDAPRPASSLAGPGPEVVPAPVATSLTGPELAELVRPPTSLIGPELAEPAKPLTSLVGPEPAAAPAPVTTLIGAELAPEARPASSLGDADELAAQAARPWWRRPFG